MILDSIEVARSLQLFNLSHILQEEAKGGHKRLGLTREVPLRNKFDVGRLVVAFGSYDPLSISHEALFLRGLETAKSKPAVRGEDSLDELLIATSTAHFEKNIDFRQNSAIYDRLHSLEGFASSYENVSLAFFNDAYFVNLVPALEKLYGRGTNIFFVVGADVMEKIADPNSYKIHRAASAETIMADLFKQHHYFIISDRVVTYNDGRPSRLLTKDQLIEEYATLKPYQNRMIPLTLSLKDFNSGVPIDSISSTLIRTKISNGEHVDHFVDHLLGIGLASFIEKRHLYQKDSNRYEALVRARQLFADCHRKQGQPIGKYLDALMNHLELMEDSPELRQQTIEDHKVGNYRLVTS